MQLVNKIGSAFLRTLLLRMKELGLNKSALARRMNVSRAYVSKVLSGDVNFSFATAIRFAHALQMDFVPMLSPAKKEDAASQELEPLTA